MQFSMVGLIDRELSEKEKAEKEKIDKDNLKMRASEIGRCKLLRYLKSTGVKGTEPEARSLRIFAVGNMVHELIQNVTKKTGISVLSEEELTYKINGEVVATGHLDDLIEVDDEGKKKYILYDYKTVHSRKFHYMKDGADTHYYKQALLYYMMLKQTHPEYVVDSIRILYISKDDLCMKEVSVPIDENEIANIHADLTDMYERVKNKQKPEAQPENEWECSETYCPYYLMCEKGIDKEKSKQEKTLKKAAKNATAN